MQFLHLYPRICHNDSRLGSAEERVGMRLMYCRDNEVVEVRVRRRAARCWSHHERDVLDL